MCFLSQFVTYPKMWSDSGLRVMISMAVRGHLNAANGCNRWYLTFDNNRCTNPVSVAVQDYSASTGDYHLTSSGEYQPVYGISK